MRVGGWGKGDRAEWRPCRSLRAALSPQLLRWVRSSDSRTHAGPRASLHRSAPPPRFSQRSAVWRTQGRYIWLQSSSQASAGLLRPALTSEQGNYFFLFYLLRCLLPWEGRGLAGSAVEAPGPGEPRAGVGGGAALLLSPHRPLRSGSPWVGTAFAADSGPPPAPRLATQPRFHGFPGTGPPHREAGKESSISHPPLDHEGPGASRRTPLSAKRRAICVTDILVWRRFNPKILAKALKSKGLGGKERIPRGDRKLTGEWAQRDNSNSQAPGLPTQQPLPLHTPPGPRGPGRPDPRLIPL